MKKNSGIRLFMIILLSLIFLIPIYPTIKWVQLPKSQKVKAEMKFEKPDEYEALSYEDKLAIDQIKEIKNQSINLGLDLQGGMHIVLEADISKLNKPEEKADAVNRALEIIRNRIDQFGVSEPLILKQGENRIVVELPGIKDPKRAESLLNVQGELSFKLVDKELSDPKNFKDYTKGILNDDIKLPEDKEILFNYDKDKNTGKLVQKEPVVLNKEPILNGGYLKNAGVQFGQFQDAVVSFSLKAEGAEMFYKGTSANVGKHLAIVLDNKVRSYPVIKEALHDGGQISGNFQLQEAQDLALVLRAGATPVKLSVMEKRIVGPSLGEDSIAAGFKAGLIASAFVILFMLFYYKASGIIANIALFLNIYYLIAILIWLKYTLTLPGLAGIILTIGMAVDANVLIFERIKEELALGKSLLASIDAGYEKAFSAIFDSNITTLITAFILAQFGTGPIKGFAVTLFWGVTINLFTAVYVTHVIYDYIAHKLHIHKISI